MLLLMRSNLRFAFRRLHKLLAQREGVVCDARGAAAAAALLSMNTSVSSTISSWRISSKKSSIVAIPVERRASTSVRDR